MVEADLHDPASEEMREAFKTQLRTWQGIGIQSLRRMFAAAGGPILDREAFVGVAQKFGLNESCVDDFGGKIDTNDFLKSLRVPFPERS